MAEKENELKKESKHKHTVHTHKEDDVDVMDADWKRWPIIILFALSNGACQS